MVINELEAMETAGCRDVMANAGEKLRKLDAADATMPETGDGLRLILRVLCVCSGFTRPAEAIKVDI
jgi:hydroxymethylpyrimidine pyrophosphatase-like HAD family hydrolase